MKKIVFIILAFSLTLYLLIFKSFNKETYIEGNLLDCRLNPINNKTIFVAIFKDIAAIKNLNPIKYTFIENKSNFKLRTTKLNLNNFFILAYTVEKKIIHAPLASSLINNWESSFTSLSANVDLILCKKETSVLEETGFFNFDEKVSSSSLLEPEYEEEAFYNIKKPKKSEEYYLYKINGSIETNNFNKVCKEHYNNLQFFVEIYDEKLELYYPVNKNLYSIKNKKPLDSVILDCSVNNFELRFKSHQEEIYPYIVARVIDLYNKKTLYFALADEINAIPLSILSKRKDNTPFSLKLEKNTNADFGTLIIKTPKTGLIAEIVNLPNFNTNLEKAYLSNKDGLISIDKLPLNSTLSLNIIDPKTLNTVSFEVFFEYPNQYISIPNLFSNKLSLTLIHKYYFETIASLSKNPSNKFNLAFNNYFEIIKNLKKDTIFLNLKDIDANTYNLTINLYNNLIIEPTPITLFELSGNINYLDKNEKTSSCISCKISLDEEQTKTYENSYFLLKLSKPRIDNSIYIEVEDQYYINNLLINSEHTLKLDINLPSKYFINTLNSISPSRANRSMIFSYLQSDKVYLVRGKHIAEAKYYDNKYYFIPDLEAGSYTIFYIDNNLISKIRNINIRKNGVYIIQ